MKTKGNIIYIYEHENLKKKKYPSRQRKDTDLQYNKPGGRWLPLRWSGSHLPPHIHEFFCWFLMIFFDFIFFVYQTPENDLEIFMEGKFCQNKQTLNQLLLQLLPTGSESHLEKKWCTPLKCYLSMESNPANGPPDNTIAMFANWDWWRMSLRSNFVEV